MHRRRREHHHHRSSQARPRRISLTSALRKPATQIGFLLVVALVIFLILQFGASKTTGLPATVSVSEAHDLFEKGAFVLDVRTQEEWNEFHIPQTQLIPLDQLPSRLSEIPSGRQIVVVCRSGNRSQKGRDILLNAGFKEVTSMEGGLNEWRASGYPLEP